MKISIKKKNVLLICVHCVIVSRQMITIKMRSNFNACMSELQEKLERERERRITKPKNYGSKHKAAGLIES